MTKIKIELQQGDKYCIRMFSGFFLRSNLSKGLLFFKHINKIPFVLLSGLFGCS
jgi:hypothetical protein